MELLIIKTEIIKKKEAKQKKENLENFDENLIRLEKLGKLYKDGIITKEEFEEKRNKSTKRR